jgi:hypothetical protein
MRIGLLTLMLFVVVGSAADRPDNALLNAKASAPVSDNGNVVIFSGTKYFLRSTKDGQYVLTPGGQEDLQRWTDMITLSYYPEITEGKSLAAKAIDWWDHCRSTRIHILEINFVPRIDQMPARDNAIYTTFTLLAKPYNDYDEFAYTALRIVEGIGATSTYSHREYRTDLVSSERDFTWARKNKPVGEAWFVWDGVSEYARALAARHPAIEGQAKGVRF